MQVLIGTSGFSYKAWRGSFYPEKWPEAKMLGYYAERRVLLRIDGNRPVADVTAACIAALRAAMAAASSAP